MPPRAYERCVNGTIGPPRSVAIELNLLDQLKAHSEYYRATNIKYVGGYFGNCSEVGMMQALQHGPVAVGIAVPGSFESYTGGIYEETAMERSNRLQGKCEAGDITACGVGHAVLVVGYGSLNGTKYW